MMMVANIQTAIRYGIYSVLQVQAIESMSVSCSTGNSSTSQVQTSAEMDGLPVEDFKELPNGRSKQHCILNAHLRRSSGIP